ncbi:alpha/beta hydrolase family protein [Amycolatopsis tucumanensis]|uniref:Prolyl oligopeptidase family serine peptidase n=1 Tax=Amycolatopsis tucumanensis TaxID=401106 RepID=A0ABP7IVQ8_9PSEU|nr:alpha/beta hydrolase [Amycolatopsis tucumanensis]MCF6424169.1 alpha/beta hydrolase [Amycolatopsis tucumanensis]
MFEPFPDKYVWNLSVGIALAVGGLIGEVDRACRPLHDLATDDDEATQAFFRSWSAVADNLVELAEEDEKRGRRRSAGQKYGRAAVYYQTAERMQAHSFEPRKVAYRNALDSFARYLELTEQPAERVEIPYGGASLPGILVRPDTPDPVPCVLFFNGLDSTKEQLYGSGTAEELRRRGIATLMVDTPGAGEALRLRGLTAVPETEQWAAACIDYLATRPDVDEDMVGMLAWSLGGYYGPRATAFEPRIRFGVAWGSNYDWGQVQLRRLENQGDRPVPHYWEHVKWVWGCHDLDEFLALAPKITLRGIMDRVTVPFLVVHGENDRQIPVHYANDLFHDLVNSPKRELKIFTDREGGVEHCSIDNLPVVRDYICDWIGETVTELRGQR